MLKNRGMAAAGVACVLACVLSLARDVPIARASDDAAEIAKLKTEIEPESRIINFDPAATWP